MCNFWNISRIFKAVDPNAEEVEYEVVTATTGGTFQLNNAKHYVPVVPLSINDNIKFLENIKQGFKRTTSWNKYRSEITTQTENNNLFIYFIYFIYNLFIVDKNIYIVKYQ